MDSKPYGMFGREAGSPGDFQWVVRVLTDVELEEEILGGVGEDGYRLALIREADRRGAAPPREEN